MFLEHERSISVSGKRIQRKGGAVMEPTDKYYYYYYQVDRKIRFTDVRSISVSGKE